MDARSAAERADERAGDVLVRRGDFENLIGLLKVLEDHREQILSGLLPSDDLPLLELTERIEALVDASITIIRLRYLKTLQKAASSAINVNRMEVQPRQMQDVENELAGLQERGAAISSAIDTAASLGLKGVDTQMRVAGFHEIANRCEAIARHIGMQAVAEGDMSQAQLSRILGVAPLTVNRWVKAMREGRDPLEEGSSK